MKKLFLAGGAALGAVVVAGGGYFAWAGSGSAEDEFRQYLARLDLHRQITFESARRNPFSGRLVLEGVGLFPEQARSALGESFRIESVEIDEWEVADDGTPLHLKARVNGLPQPNVAIARLASDNMYSTPAVQSFAPPSSGNMLASLTDVNHWIPLGQRVTPVDLEFEMTYDLDSEETSFQLAVDWQDLWGASIGIKAESVPAAYLRSQAEQLRLLVDLLAQLDSPTTFPEALEQAAHRFSSTHHEQATVRLISSAKLAALEVELRDAGGLGRLRAYFDQYYWRSPQDDESPYLAQANSYADSVRDDLVRAGMGPKDSAEAAQALADYLVDGEALRIVAAPDTPVSLKDLFDALDGGDIGRVVLLSGMTVD